MSEFKPNELWKAIILYGLNQASCKMALGKVLIDQTTIGANEIPWHQLSKGSPYNVSTFERHIVLPYQQPIFS